MKYKMVNDLGSGAYLLMHGFKPAGRKNGTIMFKVENEEEETSFDKLSLDYLKSDFHRFDSCLMSLKKIGQFKTAEENYKESNDLGGAAYLMMHDCEVVGRDGNSIYFKVEKEEEFYALVMDYLTSEFHRFDSCLMSLKKIGNYMPPLSESD